jgi:hypothetical protein
MLVACRLAGLSALEGHYAGFNGRAQFGATRRPQQDAHAARRTSTLPNERRSEPERLLVQAGRNGNGRIFPDSEPSGHLPSGRSRRGRFLAKRWPERRGSQPTRKPQDV